MIPRYLCKSLIKTAECLWWKSVQQDSFPDDVVALSAGRPLASSSRLRQLSPMLDAAGVIRLESRIVRAEEVLDSAKRPIVLDPKHAFTRLLIHRHHVIAGHHGWELVLTELRQRYWILGGRAAVRRSWSNCRRCKHARSKPQIPGMASLPSFRLTPNVCPFSTSGMDYFGPMNVKIGRRVEKRYGVLFTCLTTCAVHLELASSLTTDSCILAIRRFISRRGHPRKMLSDNGTNLRGSDKALKAALRELSQDDFIAELTPKAIEWHFNPPSAPHMGGAWQMLVRSVKIALKESLKEQNPTEETLLTVLTEAEALLNSRPLT